MLDQKIFGERLRGHRVRLNLTQEEVAGRLGVSPQAVSKWECGECLPDCFNLKMLGEVYGVSLDILLETDSSDDIDSAAAKIEQIADEYIWSKSERGYPVHRDLGADLLKLWKGIYFIEVGDREIQKLDKKDGNLRILSDFGAKVWDDEGVVAVVSEDILGQLDKIGERELAVMRIICSEDGLKLLSALGGGNRPIAKDEIAKKSGLDEPRLNQLLLSLIESGVIEFVSRDGHYASDGYKICARCGIVAFLAAAALFLLSKKKYTVSEYITAET